MFIQQIRLKSRDGTISRLASLRLALEASHTEMEKRLWISERRAAELTRNQPM
jgi:hypothetical protein